MKKALFIALGGLCMVTGSTTMEALKNAGLRMPWTMAAIVVGGLSLIGVPLTTGFISKWYLVSAALEQDYWWLAGLILLGSLITAAYVWKILDMAYFRKAPDTQIVRAEPPLSLSIPTWILVIGNIYFGMDANFTASTATQAAFAILGVTP